MNLLGKLAVTLVMLAIGVAPALALHSGSILPALPGSEAGPSGSPPETEPGHDQEPPAEPDPPFVGIPSSEDEWAAWTALRNRDDGSAVDPADPVEIVETPVVDPAEAGWVYEEPEDSGWVYDEPEDSGWVYEEPEDSGWVYEEPEDSGWVYDDPELQPDGSGIAPAEDPSDDAVEDEPEDGGGLLGILG